MKRLLKLEENLDKVTQLSLNNVFSKRVTRYTTTVFDKKFYKNI